MAADRWYDDACGTALAMELVGERWSLLVVRELMFGPRRFGELRAGLPGISANILTQRLAGLERAGIVRRHRLPPPSNVQVYELTPWGQEAEESIKVLGRWAARSPDHDPTLPLSAASLMLSFRTMISAERAAGFAARVGFRLGVDTFVAQVADGTIPIVRGDPEQADAWFDSTPEAIAAIVYGGLPIAAAEGEGMVRIGGDRAVAERFVTLFVLPPKAAA